MQPEGYDDIPAMIKDADAKRPEDWDEEEDGVWEAPELPNPAFKGPWAAKQISNPAYKGAWEARHPPCSADEVKMPACRKQSWSPKPSICVGHGRGAPIASRAPGRPRRSATPLTRAPGRRTPLSLSAPYVLALPKRAS